MGVGHTWVRVSGLDRDEMKIKRLRAYAEGSKYKTIP